MISLHDTFIEEVETFLDKTKMLPTVFGKAAASDGNFVQMLRRGRSPSARKIDEVRKYMNSVRPDIVKNGKGR